MKANQEAQSVSRFRGRRLWVLVLGPTFTVVVMVLIAILVFHSTSQTDLVNHLTDDQNTRLANIVNNAVFDALSTGDNKVVRAQFARLNEKLSGVMIYIYDYRGIVSFSTDSSKIGMPVGRIFENTEAALSVHRMLSDHRAPDAQDMVTLAQERYSVRHLPIFNERSCHHCHGQSQKLLGGISVASSFAAALNAMHTTRNKSVLIGLVGLAILVSAIYLLFFVLVNKPVHLILNHVQKLRQGDFTHQVHTRRTDELAHITNRLNLVSTDLRNIFKEFAGNSDRLAESSAQLSGISQTLRTEAESTSAQSADLAQATRNVSATMNSVAASMEQTATNINLVTTRSDELFKTIGEIAQSSGKAQTVIISASERFNDVSKVVKELGRAAKEIDVVTEGIRNVSDQVNLLALNATIEAARAGEAGRGFAVVAQEIKELAKQAAAANDDANQKLRWMQSKTDETVGKIEQICAIMEEADQSVKTIAGAVEEQSASTKEIAENMAEATAGVSEVNHSIARMAHTSEQVSGNVNTVDVSTQQVLAGSESVNQQAADLARLAEAIRTAVHRFSI